MDQGCMERFVFGFAFASAAGWPLLPLLRRPPRRNQRRLPLTPCPLPPRFARRILCLVPASFKTTGTRPPMGNSVTAAQLTLDQLV